MNEATPPPAPEYKPSPNDPALQECKVILSRMRDTRAGKNPHAQESPFQTADPNSDEQIDFFLDDVSALREIRFSDGAPASQFQPIENALRGSGRENPIWRRLIVRLGKADTAGDTNLVRNDLENARILGLFDPTFPNASPEQQKAAEALTGYLSGLEQKYALNPVESSPASTSEQRHFSDEYFSNVEEPRDHSWSDTGDSPSEEPVALQTTTPQASGKTLEKSAPEPSQEPLYTPVNGGQTVSKAKRRFWPPKMPVLPFRYRKDGSTPITR